MESNQHRVLAPNPTYVIQEQERLGLSLPGNATYASEQGALSVAGSPKRGHEASNNGEVQLLSDM